MWSGPIRKIAQREKIVNAKEFICKRPNAATAADNAEHNLAAIFGRARSMLFVLIVSGTCGIPHHGADP
jgi:hypothetical protein